MGPPVRADEARELAAKLVGLGGLVWLAWVGNGSSFSPPSAPIASGRACGTSQTLCESNP